MVEAAALLSTGAPAVLVVVAEEYPPEPYRDWIDDVPFSYALALRVRGIETDDATPASARWQLRLEPNRGDDASGAWPHALQFVRALHQHTDTLEHVWKTRRWIWQRVP
jgi:hypothetical protein